MSKVIEHKSSQSHFSILVTLQPCVNGTVNNPIGCFNLVIETFFKSSLTLRQSSVIIFSLISIVLMLISVEVDVEHGKGSVSCLYIVTEESIFFFFYNFMFNSGTTCAKMKLNELLFFLTSS